jgi:hypothetical protein
MCCRRSSESFFDSESSVAACESPPPCVRSMRRATHFANGCQEQFFRDSFAARRRERQADRELCSGGPC